MQGTNLNPTYLCHFGTPPQKCFDTEMEDSQMPREYLVLANRLSEQLDRLIAITKGLQRFRCSNPVFLRILHYWLHNTLEAP